MVAQVIKWILLRNYVLLGVVCLVLFKAVNWEECFQKRGRYLLGIVYNGKFLNAKDNQVYEDFLKRHGQTPEEFQKGL